MQDYIVPVHHRELSIQIGLNGFSFVVFNNAAALTSEAIKEESVMYSAIYGQTSLAEIVAAEPVLTDRSGFNRVFVGCSTDDVLLVPGSLFEPARADQYLAAANMHRCGLTTLSNSLISKQAVAVWQADAGVVADLIGYYPAALFYHPLLLELDTTGPGTVSVVLDRKAAHITVCHAGLYAAETFRVESREELLYYVMRLLKQEATTTYRVVLIGEGAEKLTELFGRYFTEVEAREQRFYNHQRIREVCVL